MSERDTTPTERREYQRPETGERKWADAWDELVEDVDEHATFDEDLEAHRESDVHDEPQPPEEHGDEAHDETVASSDDVDALEDRTSGLSEDGSEATFDALILEDVSE